jgi:hypothetical protein
MDNALYNPLGIFQTQGRISTMEDHSLILNSIAQSHMAKKLMIMTHMIYSSGKPKSNRLSNTLAMLTWIQQNFSQLAVLEH